MKKLVFALLISIFLITPSFSEEQKKGGGEEGFCATCPTATSKALYDELTWAPVSQIVDLGGGAMKTTFTDGSYITTYDAARNTLIGTAFANQLNVIIHWTSLYSWDMIYIGK